MDTGGYTALDFALHDSHVLNTNVFMRPLGMERRSAKSHLPYFFFFFFFFFTYKTLCILHGIHNSTEVLIINAYPKNLVIKKMNNTK